MALQHGLDLGRIDVESRDENHVLLAVDDKNEALFVDIADVTGAQKAISVEGRCGFIRALPVTLRHLRPAYADLADLSDGCFQTGIIPDR